MFDIKKEELKKNKLFFLISFLVIILFILLSLFISKNNKLETKDLEENGNNTISKLLINEIVTSNDGVYSSEDGSVCDFIELYNGTANDINLKNYGLSDEKKKSKWAFPEVTIKSNEYLIVNLCGTQKNGLYAPFKLKSCGGETIALTNANGKVIDAVETTNLDKNTSMGRDLNGNWHTFEQVTPGFANTIEGYNKYIESLNGEEDILKITEFLPKNNGNFKINDQFLGYIELTNTGDEEINLKNYTLSSSDDTNNMNSIFKYNLPDKILKPNEVVVLYTSGKNKNNDIIETNFKLNSKNGVIILGKNGKIIEKQEYKNLENGIAMIKVNNQFVESNVISPGYSNDNNGVEKFNEKISTPDDLIINEVMNNNYSYMPQNGNNYYSWVELKNNSNHEINLKNYNLSSKDTKMFNLPDKTLKSGEYYIVMLSGDSNLTNDSYIHTNFKLSKIESLYLFKDNNIIDSVMISNIPNGYSYGRGQHGFYYISSPTPNKSNNTGTREISATPLVSISSGIYNNVDSVEITINAPGTIYYTLDGSKPTTSSNVYKSPLFIKKTSVLKVISKEDGKVQSNVVTKSYIVNENHTLPVMSVSLNPNEFRTLEANTNSNIEYSAYAELYENGKSFSIPCGIKLFGGSTRSLPKKSYALKFKKKYGKAKLNYKVFDDRDFSSFDTLVLRSGSQDYKTTFLRDILGTSMVDEYTSVDVQAYKSVILYINGEYHGIYNIREKVDETFISNHYNVNEEDANIMRIDNIITVGTSKFYTSILNYVNNNNMALQKNYDYIKEKINIENMADYWIAELYVTNNDIINCRFFSHKDVDNGKLHFIFYDLDYAWYNYRNNYYSFILNPNGMQEGYNLDTSLMRNMIKNDTFKKIFLERLSYNMKNTWKKENILKKLDEIYNKLAPEMERDVKRWGSSIEEWNENIDKLKEYIDKREDYLLSQTKTQFGLSNAQMKEYFGD